MNLFEAIFEKVSLDRTAILYEQRRIRYAELRDQTLAVGRVLSVLEVERGDRVALLLNDSPEFIAAFIAICSYGAIAVPINMALRLDEQRAILNDCSASLAIIEQDLCRTMLVGATDEPPHLGTVVVVGRQEAIRQRQTVLFFAASLCLWTGKRIHVSTLEWMYNYSLPRKTHARRDRQSLC